MSHDRGNDDALPEPLVIRAPGWMRWLGPVLLLGWWLCMVAVVVFAFREGDWKAPVRDAGLGWVGASFAWVIVVFFLLVIPPCIRVLLTFRMVLDAQGVVAPFGRGRFGLEQIKSVRWIPQGGPVNAANRPERFEVMSQEAGLVAKVARQEADWEDARAIFRHWARLRPDLIRDEATAAAISAPGPD